MSHLEIDKQIDRLKLMIELENRVKDSMKKYKDCAIKSSVLDYCSGAIVGLEAGIEALEYLKGQKDTGQLSADEWFLHEKRMKEIAQIDYRGGLAR